MRLAQEARRIAAQHQFLDALEATTLRVLEQGDAHQMADAIQSFESALLAHFGIEEKVQFPALHGLDPRFDAELTELVRSHERFRSEVRTLCAQVGGRGPNGGRPELLSEFGRLVVALRGHEEREEKLLAEASRSD